MSVFRCTIRIAQEGKGVPSGDPVGVGKVPGHLLLSTVDGGMQKEIE